VSVQEGRDDLEIEFQREISKIIGDIEILDVDIELGFKGIGKGFGITLKHVWSIIDLCGKSWLNKGFDLGGDIRQEWNPDIQFSYCVSRLLGAIPEINASVFDTDVVE
jgi:hypothetical protein